MSVLIYGASGMVGQGILRECMKAKDVETVTVIVRSPLSEQHPGLEVVVNDDLISPLADANAAVNWDAFFFAWVSAPPVCQRKITVALPLN